MTPISRSERNRQIESSGRSTFAGHQLLREESDRWLIGKLGDSAFAAEICILRFSSVLVHGDISAVLLRGGYGDNPELQLAWAASSGLDYLASKLCDMPCEEWDRDVALHDLAQAASEARETGSQRADGLEDVLFDFRYGLLDNAHDLHQALYDATDGDWELRCGYVEPSSLIYGREAIRRLIALRAEAQQGTVLEATP